MSRRRRNETEEQRARRELISDFLSAANIQSMNDIQDLFKEALAGFMEGSLESELDDELGYEPYDVKNKETDNSRNGHSNIFETNLNFSPKFKTYIAEIQKVSKSLVIKRKI